MATLFGALLSARPYPHYLIQLLPAINSSIFHPAEFLPKCFCSFCFRQFNY